MNPSPETVFPVLPEQVKNAVSKEAHHGKAEEEIC